ncbi:MAG: saccharopine dehydrogenase NADP-binding domain-containing protein [Alphaproteobacteria bacterium]|nr:saccharopine dehydrogenase NADP-binding domain-containing protein [Alphaproteobacteria bacterium]
MIIGLGAIGRGLLPLIERHFEFDKDRCVVIDCDEQNRALVDERGIRFLRMELNPRNLRDVLTPLLTNGEGQPFCVNVAVDVSSLAVMRLCRELGALYIDAATEPWLEVHGDDNITLADKTCYAYREESILKEKPSGPPGTVTAVTCSGANPGMVSWLTKQALLNLAADLGMSKDVPQTQEAWARLMRDCGVKGIHIAERDTQQAKHPRPVHVFSNTWSPECMMTEALRPAEIGWGTHEKWMPANACQHDYGTKAAIYMTAPGGSTRVRTWCPGVGGQSAFLIPHEETVSIADYFTLGEGAEPAYRPTCHYAYHPCDHAVLSLHEMFGRSEGKQKKKRVLAPQDIVSGSDELGVLLYGHARNAYWYGSHLTIEEARQLAPYQNATTMQVTSGVLAGMVWALENPKAGIVEPEEMDFSRCLEVQRPYLGTVKGVYTNWTPLESVQDSYPEDIDADDPWQFRNILEGNAA